MTTDGEDKDLQRYGHSLTLLAATLLAACEEPPSGAARLDDPALESVREWVAGTDTAPVAPAATANATSVAPVGDMIGGLEQRLRDSPNDVKGWSLLAQSYAYTGQTARANAAVEHAVSLGANRADLEARILAAGHR